MDPIAIVEFIVNKTVRERNPMALLGIVRLVVAELQEQDPQLAQRTIEILNGHHGVSSLE